MVIASRLGKTATKHFDLQVLGAEILDCHGNDLARLDRLWNVIDVEPNDTRGNLFPQRDPIFGEVFGLIREQKLRARLGCYIYWQIGNRLSIGSQL